MNHQPANHNGSKSRAECIRDNELERFEERLRKAGKAYAKKHGCDPNSMWFERHRARFRSFLQAQSRNPDLSFEAWAQDYRAPEPQMHWSNAS